MTTNTLGIDFGGSKVLACVVDEHGQILARTRQQTGRTTDPQRALELVQGCGDSLRSQGASFSRIGVGFAGLVDSTRGIVRSSVMFDDWRDVPFASAVEQRCGVPCIVDNDVNMAAICELSLRAAEPPALMVFVAVGTGIGGAICFHGRLHRGANGIAGEIGNMTIDWEGAECWCKRRGCLNTLASGTAIERALGHSVRDLTSAGLPEPVVRAARALGVGLGNVMNLLDPDLIVLGGGVLETGSAYFHEVVTTARKEAFSECAVRCLIELPRGGYDSGAIGAALASRDAVPTRAHAHTG